jgi:ABC-type uncharacterized transport system involved in gliding motility auxiliary subunit
VRATDEQELTNAIIKVAEQSKKTIYFLTGHGEGDINEAETAEGYKALADAIRADGYDTKTLSLQASADKADAKINIQNAAPVSKLEVPQDVAVLIIAGARHKLLVPEVAALEEYLNRGGRVVAFLDPDVDVGIDNLLAAWKIGVQKDLVVDSNPLNHLLGLGPASPLATAVDEQDPITKDLGAPVVLVTTRSLIEKQGGTPGVIPKALLRSSDSAWGETDLRDGEAAKDAQDNKGPVVLAMLSTLERADNAPENHSKEARLVVFGDSDFVSNKYLSMQANKDVALNVVSYAAEEEGKISIRPKMRVASQLMLTEEQVNGLKFLSMDLLPVLIVAIGLGVVLIRRQR